SSRIKLRESQRNAAPSLVRDFHFLYEINVPDGNFTHFTFIRFSSINNFGIFTKKEGKHPMGLRFRKRVKIAPGVHVNLGKRGASLSVGGRGASVNVSKRGTYGNVGIPGTGISYREKIGGRSKRPQRVAYEKVNHA